MSWQHLGEIFDIHGGGIDLVFPHHENEIAQTCSAFGHDVMANFWMHNGHLQVEGEKMSKSLGNFVTIHELLHSDKFGGRSWPGEVLRLALLRTHYRQPIDFTVKALEEAEKTLGRWDALVHAFEASPVGRPSMLPAQFFDDMNTPIAIASLHAVADNLSTLASKNDAKAIGEFLASIELLGINMSPEARRQRTKSDRAENCRSPRRPRSKKLERIRSHPRRARRHRDRAQGQQRRHDHLGSEALISHAVIARSVSDEAIQGQVPQSSSVCPWIASLRSQ
jgi:cysteinyl-tRNA synthetase